MGILMSDKSIWLNRDCLYVPIIYGYDSCRSQLKK